MDQPTMEPEAVVKVVFSLFDDHGEARYIGEEVSQLSHALQTAQQAEAEGFPKEVVFGALLHDVGHLLGIRDGQPKMVTDGVNLGTAQHEVVGEEYLRCLGFPSAVTSFVRNHVEAKRFLVATDSAYYEGLSKASKMTLEHQGGPMTPVELDKFRADPQFEAILRMRSWDERAKDPGAVTPSLQHYRDLCLAFLKESRQKAQKEEEA